MLPVYLCVGRESGSSDTAYTLFPVSCIPTCTFFMKLFYLHVSCFNRLFKDGI